MPVIAVAALSARPLAQAARDDGYRVIGLDLFGDADTRAACIQWLPIGDASTLCIDTAALLDALAILARRGDVVGWVVGSGFEGRPDLLERGAALLPLIGNRADAVRRVRDPAAFFGFLDRLGIDHPAVSLRAPETAGGWLLKDAHGCGGSHIRRATAACRAESDHHYFQREAGGAPMSATFIAAYGDADADAAEAAFVLGFNQLVVRGVGDRPFVYCGVVGPVALPGDAARQAGAAVREIAAEFGLRGLASLDFLLDGDAISVLEVNPRPPASMALYGPNLFEAHRRACVGGDWRAGLAPPADAVAHAVVRGVETVFAPRSLRLDAATARAIAALPDCHDWPAAARFEAGDPLCSVAAAGSGAEAVHALLAQRRQAVHRLLENLS